MKTVLVLLSLFATTWAWSQKGEVWPIYSSQTFDLDKDFQITKEYEVKNVAGYFMFLNNNEFFHVTDNITSLYKIIKRKEGETDVVYTAVSEAGNVYTFSFDKTKKDVILFSEKGFGNYYKVLTPYVTTVFDNVNQ